MKLYRRGRVYWVTRPTWAGGQRTSLRTTDRRVAVARRDLLAWTLAHQPDALSVVLSDWPGATGAWGTHTLTTWLAARRTPALAPYVDGWVAWLTGQRAVGALQVDRYRLTVARFLAEAGVTRAADWTPKVTFGWLNALPFAAPRRAKAALSSFARYLVTQDVMPHNPTRDLPALREPPPREAHVTPSEALHALQKLPSGPERAYHALCLAYPIELGAAFALTWGDMGVTVRARGTKRASRDRQCWTTPAWSDVLALFQRWAESHRGLPTARVFQGTTPRRVRQALAGTFPEGYRVHDHRRSWGVQAAKDGYSYQAIASNEGHTSPAMAMRVYAKYHHESHHSSHSHPEAVRAASR